MTEEDRGSWRSHGKIFNLGHAATKNLFLEEVIVEEKIDGSQFSLGKYIGLDGHEELKIRSKGAQMIVDAPEKMFKAAAETAIALMPELRTGWMYRCEYLAKPKHNVLAYERTPVKNIILFDVCTGEEKYLTYEEKAAEAARLGLEVVPLMYKGKIENAEQVREFLDRPSILGGQKVEGVVIKNYARFGIDGKVLMGKFVSEAFKEVHGGEWREANPGSGDILQRLGEKFRTPARWNKAIQHLREAGKLENSPKDIGTIMKEVPPDLESECKQEILDALWDWAWPHIRRKSTAGLPEYYKDVLLKSQFENPVEEIKA